jgi:hypothetical protein
MICGKIKSMNKTKLLLFIIFVLPSLSHAQRFGGVSKGSLTLEPILGYERVQKIEPTARTTNRFYYGVRASYGIPLLSAEGELTRAQESENFPEQDLKIDETSTTLMLGLRSNFNHRGMIGAYLRAGGHARKSEIEKIEDGVKTSDDPSVRLSPYAGAGLNFRLASYFRLNAGITVVFTGEPKGSDKEYRTSLGFSINI